MRAAETGVPGVLLQHRGRGGVSFRVRVGEDGVGCWVEGTEGGGDGVLGRGADGCVGGCCGGDGGGDREGD